MKELFSRSRTKILWNRYRLAKAYGTPTGNTCDHVERHASHIGSYIPVDIKSYFMKSNGSVYWLEQLNPPRWFIYGELYGLI